MSSFWKFELSALSFIVVVATVVYDSISFSLRSLAMI